MSRWETIYKREGLKFASKLGWWSSLVSLLKQRNCKTILDLGCGVGTHMTELADAGFEVTGMDISEEAIKTAAKQLREQGLNADLVVSSMHNPFPFSGGLFDCVLCLRTINHGTKEKISVTIEEIYRVLKPGGILFLTTIKIPGKKKILGPAILNGLSVEIVAPYTYRPMEGKEKGIIHFMFSKALLRKMFNKLKIDDIWVEQGEKYWERYYCLLARK